MTPIYHTYCDNCDGQHHYIPNILKESSRCKYCGVYLNNSYDLECDYLNGVGVICLICDEIQQSIDKIGCYICKNNILKSA